MPSPGKILHELRRGKAATSWFPIYYGSIDATPLFLVLLSEVWRWTGDAAIVKELEPAARAALTWIDEYGDRDGDGFLEYERRAPTRARESILEGLRRLTTLPRREACLDAHRPRRGAGVRLRRAPPGG